VKKTLKMFMIVAVCLLAAAGAFGATAAAKSDAKAPASDSGKTFETGMMVATLGIGIGIPLPGNMLVPPIIAGFDYDMRVAPKFPLSIGGVIGYAGTEETVPGFTDYKWDYSVILIGARGAFHFTDIIEVKNLDVYAGLMLGYYIVSATVKAPSGAPELTGVTASASGFAFGIYGGARYFFTPMIGAYAELGYGFGYINAGVAFKF
jgi:hypothetical protein